MKHLMRPELFGLKPYVSARALSGGQNVPIGLDANENPWPPFGPIAALCPVNRYVGEALDVLRSRVAEISGVAMDQVVLGRGSTESIDLLVRLFCRAGVDEILVCPPTFLMYRFSAAVQGAAVISVPLLGNGQLDVAGVLAACTPNTKVIFIPSPNAPMGHAMNRDDILSLCDGRANHSVVVVDEAYVAFTDRPRGLVDVLDSHPNLVLIRTLSKAHALAGERIGFALSSLEIADMLARATPPYPLAHSAALAALDALSSEGLARAEERIGLLKRERARMAALLPLSPMIVRVFESVTNFFLIECRDVQAVQAVLMERGIRARPHVCEIPNTLRFSLGRPEENDALLAALGCGR